VGFFHDHERAARGVQSGESLHQLMVGLMAAPLGVGLPVGGIMARHRTLAVWGSLGEDPVLVGVRRRSLAS
jgi:hypothetical protein